MKPVVLFNGTSGLNNIVDPIRINHKDQSGFCELAEAYNVDIDISGRISRRKGWTTTAITENCHSIFCDGGDCLYVSEDALYRLNKDYSRIGLRSGLTLNARMSYCQIANTIYYTNGHENGYVRDDTSYVWYAQPYIGSVTTRVFNNPPLGNLLEYYSSRIYITVRNGIEYSEPFGYSWFSAASNFIPLRSTPRMIGAVEDGIYVGLDDSVVFLGGKNPNEFIYSTVSSSPVVRGTDVKINGTQFSDETAVGKIVLWTAKDGVYVGFSGGHIKNLTKDKLVYPDSNIGCAVFKDNKYIILMK